MLPSLKTKQLTVARLDGLALTVRELTSRDMEELAAADKRTIPALVVKLGIVEWAEHSVDDIVANVGAVTLRDLGTEVYKLTGIDLAKNSEPDRTVVSISG